MALGQAPNNEGLERTYPGKVWISRPSQRIYRPDSGKTFLGFERWSTYISHSIPKTREKLRRGFPELVRNHLRDKRANQPLKIVAFPKAVSRSLCTEPIHKPIFDGNEVDRSTANFASIPSGKAACFISSRDPARLRIPCFIRTSAKRPGVLAAKRAPPDCSARLPGGLDPS